MSPQADPNTIIMVTLFKIAALPLLVAGLVTLLSGKWVLTPEKPPFLRQGATALAAALGFSAGYWALNGFNEFPPLLVQHWFPYFALAGFVLLSGAARLGLIAEGIAMALLVAGCLFLKLRPYIMNQWETAEAAAYLVPLFGVWLLLLFVGRGVVSDKNLPEIPLLLVIAMTAASLVIVMDGSASIGQAAGSMAAACGGIFLARLLVPHLGVGAPLRGTVLIVFGAMLLNGYFYVEAGHTTLILAALVPFALLVYWVPGVKDWAVWKRGALVCGVALLPLVIALVILATKPVESSYY
ncbi:hypothetical protein [Acanthopleuribacter pedis]|uniref:Transmembrane protein n=1 Tax=Acanthopleuribacter pedis TaxID=442870 RepID=A0A8J7Q4F6_9BACT|nr:hypothetical protein [Acanthopleuribacter pedis]MBO1317566.1 hypothetical protein [Acanthopleuribacter pedis]